MKQSGTVTVSQTQIAFIVSGKLGGGELTYEGKTHRFTIGGLGIGGFGGSTIKAAGEVSNLTSLDDFDGAYGQARTGSVVGDKSAKSEARRVGTECVRTSGCWWAPHTSKK